MTSPPPPASAVVAARAWVFTEAGAPMTLQHASLDASALRPGDVLVRITAATICGSDVHTIDGKRMDPAAPLVLGHEGVGVVAALGEGDEDPVATTTRGEPLAVGDRITWSVATSCGRCRPCASYGLPQKCATVKKYGHAPWRGGRPGEGFAGTYASHVLLTAGSAVCRVPPSIPDAVASPINCALATMVNAVLNSGLLAGGGRAPLGAALVQGAGMLGVYGVALLKRGLPAGARPPFVAVTDVSPARLALAARFGADAVIDVSGRDDAAVAAEVLAALAAHEAAAAAADCAPPPPPPAGVDMALEVCGSSAVVPLGLRCLRPGGEYVFVGQVHPGTPLGGITGDAVIRKCATLRGVHNYAPADLDRAVGFLAATVGELPYAALVSEPAPLDDLPAAVEAAREGRHARVVVVP